MGSTLVVVALGARPAQLVLANARLLPYGRRVALERPFDLADTARELTGLAAPGSLPQSAATALLADAPAEAPR
ncbi:MAG: hypothetical protein H6828_10195 [Planctomycetes bacterium]|nr:hypothetical protein [Planctomycetota bacterium]